MNLGGFVRSLRYINRSFDLVTSLARWLYLELEKIKYTDSKLTRSFDKEKDLDVSESVIHLVTDTNILNTLLRSSVLRNNYHQVKILIDNKADIHFNNDEALKLACSRGHLEIVKLLIESGADLNCKPSLLRFASYYGHESIIKLLLDHGANVHDNDDEALRLAAVNNHYDIIKLLLEYGADANADNDECVMSAIRNSNSKIAKLLLSYGPYDTAPFRDCKVPRCRADPSANEFEVLRYANECEYSRTASEVYRLKTEYRQRLSVYIYKRV